MKSLKVVSILAGVILLLSVVLTTANNITWGYIGPYDRLLATEYVVKSRKLLRKQTVEIVFPPKGQTNFLPITAIRVFDWGGSKNYGYVTLKKGGPGHPTATTVFKSQRNKPLSFTIEYFGR